MTWILMAFGREHELRCSGHPDNVPSIGEIGHSLAQVNRYTGHTVRPYSVAEHSLLTADIARHYGADPMEELCTLMHDAHECITGDVASPIKEEIGQVWHDFEARHQRDLLSAYRLLEPMRSHHAVVKLYDLTALATERRDLMQFNPAVNRPWPVIDKLPCISAWEHVQLMDADRVERSATAWADAFCRRAIDLFEQNNLDLA